MKKIVLLVFVFSVQSWARPPVYDYYKYSDSCPKDKPFLTTTFGVLRCVSCAAEFPMHFDPKDAEDFKICHNRMTMGSVSYLKQCPPERPLNTYDGCKACNNGAVAVWPIDDKNGCSACKDTYEMRVGQCVLKTAKPLIEIGCGDARSYECSTIRAVDTSKENCDLCPNRFFDAWKNGEGRCVLKQCPQNMIQTEYGNCVFCDENFIVTSEAECQKCSNHQYLEGVCFTKDGSFIGGYGMNDICDCRCHSTGMKVLKYSCNDPNAYEVSKQSCALCSNREYVDGKCRLKETK